MTEQKPAAPAPAAADAAKANDGKQAYIRPPAQGGKREYKLPNGTHVKHN